MGVIARTSPHSLVLSACVDREESVLLLALLLRRQYEFPIGINVVQFSIFIFYSCVSSLVDFRPSSMKETQKHPTLSRPPSLLCVLFRMFYPEMFVAHLMRLVADVLQFANPLLLKYIFSLYFRYAIIVIE